MIKKLLESSAIRLINFTDRFFQKDEDPLLRGDLVGFAKRQFPPDDKKYQVMWMSPPDDVRRDIFWDGRLLNGDQPAELAKGRVTDEVVADVIVKSGLRAFKTSAIVAAGIAAVFGYSLTSYSSGSFGYTPYPQWAADNGAWLPILAWYPLTVIEHGSRLLGAIFAGIPPLLLLFPILWLWGFSNFMDRTWKSIAMAERFPTRDTQVTWKYNAPRRPRQVEAYRRQILLATTRLKDSPFIPAGRAMGLTRALGSNLGPTEGQLIGWDMESILQHTIALGETGSGKTYLFIRPQFKRVTRAFKEAGIPLGAYVTDGKGALWRDLAPMVEDRNDVVTLGTGEGHFGLDLTAGMTPLEISTTYKAVAGQVSGKPTDDFWQENASLLLMHAAAVARFLDRHEPTRKIWMKTRKVTPYSLLGIALIAAEEAITLEALDTMRAIELPPKDQLTEEQAEDIVESIDSAKWLAGFFLKMGGNTRSSIVANLNTVLGKIRGARKVSKKFFSGIPEVDENGKEKRKIDLDFALNGGIIFVSVGETEHGMAGKVVNVWLKTRLYILAKRRMNANPNKDGKPPAYCAMFADEFQMLATSGENSDTDFWNIGRSSGLFMAGAATQSIAALTQVLGEAATANIINLMTSKIVLKMSELSTLRHIKELAGNLPQGFDQFENAYATQAVRKQLLGEINYNKPTMSMFDSLLPSVFVPLTEQASNAWGGKHIRLPARALEEVFHGSPIPDPKWAYDDKKTLGLEAELVKGMNSHVSVLTEADMLEGSGFAVAFIQRAGVARCDIIDLQIDDVA